VPVQRRKNVTITFIAIVTFSPENADHDDGNDYNEYSCYHGYDQI